MSKEHLTFFKVENFKRFDSLELTDIGQFNLVVGDNNVGKTSLLEALLATVRTPAERHPTLRAVFNLYQSLRHRDIDVKQNIDLFLKYLAKNDGSPLVFRSEYGKTVQEIDFHRKDGYMEVTLKNINPKAPPEPFNANIPNNEVEDIALIPANIKINGKLQRDYQNVLNFSVSNKRLIVDSLRVMAPNASQLEVLEIMGEYHLMIGFDNDDRYMPITGLGGGSVRMLYYMLQIIRNRGQRLMIDEIDTGIHYSRMRRFLKTIFQIAEKNDVQLFMTTHSLECQQAFAEVFEEPDMVQHQAKVRQFSLIEKVDGQVVASGRDFEQLQSALETGYDTRGGKQGW